MKISDRDKKLILIILLAAIIALPIFFFIKPKNESIKALDNELVSLNERYNYLKALSEKQPFYESEIARLNEERSNMLLGFAPGIRQENIIMFLRDVELSIPVSMHTENFGEIGKTIISESDSLYALSTATVVNYTCDYASVKEFLDTIFNNNEKMIISSIDMNYEPLSGSINGVFVLEQFAVDGTDKELEDANIPKINHGNETIFSEVRYMTPEELEIIEAGGVLESEDENAENEETEAEEETED